MWSMTSHATTFFARSPATVTLSFENVDVTVKPLDRQTESFGGSVFLQEDGR